MKNIVEVSPDEFKLINRINIESKHLAFVREAVCSGNTPMKVWVDNNEQPTSVFMWDQGWCCRDFKVKN